MSVVPSTYKSRGEHIMLNNEEVKEYSQLLKECEEANQELQQITTEIAMLKKQGIEKLKEKGYNSLADATKLDEEIKALEDEIKAEIPKMKEFIASVNEKKELKERILMG